MFRPIRWVMGQPMGRTKLYRVVPWNYLWRIPWHALCVDLIYLYWHMGDQIRHGASHDTATQHNIAWHAIGMVHETSHRINKDMGRPSCHGTSHNVPYNCRRTISVRRRHPVGSCYGILWHEPRHLSTHGPCDGNPTGFNRTMARPMARLMGSHGIVSSACHG